MFETKVSPEDEARALALQLPKNFYAYLQAPPCKGCIGCNDENFVFETPKPTAKPKVDFSFGKAAEKSNDTPQKTTVFDLSTKSTTGSVFGTPASTSIFSGTNNSSVSFGTPKSSTSSATFSFTPQNNAFSSPFTTSFSTTSSTTTPKSNNIFSAPLTQTGNMFGSGGTMIFGSTTVTPVKNNAPTLTSLLTQPSQIATPPTTAAAQPEHKSPLAPSKLSNVMSSTTSIFSSTPPIQTSSNIFGGKPSTPPLSQMLSSTKTTQPAAVFGSSPSIFGGGAKSETLQKVEATSVFGPTQNQSTIFGGIPSTQPAKTESTSIFGSKFGTQPSTPGNIFGSVGKPSGSIFGSQPVFGGGSLFGQAAKPTGQTSVFGSITTTPSTDAPAAVAPAKPKETEPVLNCDTGLSFAALASGANNSFTTKKGECSL